MVDDSLASVPDIRSCCSLSETYQRKKISVVLRHHGLVHAETEGVEGYADEGGARGN